MQFKDVVQMRKYTLRRMLLRPTFLQDERKTPDEARVWVQKQLDET